MKSLTTSELRWASDASGTWLSIRTDQARKIAESAKPGKDYDIEIKLHRNRRSLDANGYLWVLLDKLSEKLSTDKAPVTKVDVYRNLIPDVGGVSDVVCVADEAVDSVRDGWSHNGLGWVSDVLPNAVPGYSNVILYYGSSTYTTQQMSRLLSLVIEACKAQGIETMTPNELMKLEGYE